MCYVIYSVNIDHIEVAKLTISSVKKLYNALDLNLFASGIMLNYILCPLQRAENVVVTMDGNVDAVLASVSILHIPADIFEHVDDASSSHSKATAHDDISGSFDVDTLRSYSIRVSPDRTTSTTIP